MTAIKAIVSACGLKATPVNPWTKEVANWASENHRNYVAFDKANPELFLTSPQVPGAEIMIEAKHVWQYDVGDHVYDVWVTVSVGMAQDWDDRGYNIRKCYQPIQITKEAEHEINLNKTNNMSMLDPDDRKKFGSSPTEQKKPSENEMAGYSDAERIKAYMIVYEKANTLHARNFIQWCDKEEWFFMQPIKTPKLKP